MSTSEGMDKEGIEEDTRLSSSLPLGQDLQMAHLKLMDEVVWLHEELDMAEQEIIKLKEALDQALQTRNNVLGRPPCLKSPSNAAIELLDMLITGEPVAAEQVMAVRDRIMEAGCRNLRGINEGGMVDYCPTFGEDEEVNQALETLLVPNARKQPEDEDIESCDWSVHASSTRPLNLAPAVRWSSYTSQKGRFQAASSGPLTPLNMPSLLSSDAKSGGSASLGRGVRYQRLEDTGDESGVFDGLDSSLYPGRFLMKSVTGTSPLVSSQRGPALPNRPPAIWFPPTPPVRSCSSASFMPAVLEASPSSVLLQCSKPRNERKEEAKACARKSSIFSRFKRILTCSSMDSSDPAQSSVGDHQGGKAVTDPTSPLACTSAADTSSGHPARLSVQSFSRRIGTARHTVMSNISDSSARRARGSMQAGASQDALVRKSSIVLQDGSVKSSGNSRGTSLRLVTLALASPSSDSAANEVALVAGLSPAGVNTRSMPGSLVHSKLSPSANLILLKMVLQPSDELALVLAGVDEWQFNPFKLKQASQGRPLSCLAFFLMKRMDLVRKFRLDEARLARFLMRIEAGYPSNPYHSRTHAADVLRTLHVVLNRGGVLEAVMACTAKPAVQHKEGAVLEIPSVDADLDVLQNQTASKLLTCYLAAIVHDYEHRGVNNDYLIRNCDPLALLYNDNSPMENHHLAATFYLLNQDEFAFFPKSSKKLKSTVRKDVIDLVLATDMKQHFSLLGMFASRTTPSRPRVSVAGRGCSVTGGSHRRLACRSGNVVAVEARKRCLPHRTASILSLAPRRTPSPRSSEPNFNAVECPGPATGTYTGQYRLQHTAGVVKRNSNSSSPMRISHEDLQTRGHGNPSSLGSLAGDRGASFSTSSAVAPVWDSETQTLILKVALKCADLGGLTSSHEVYKEWVSRLEEEMFRQGDMEKKLGQALSPLMDRDKGGVMKSQCSFFMVVAVPLYKAFAQVFPLAASMLENLEENYSKESDVEKQAHLALLPEK